MRRGNFCFIFLAAQLVLGSMCIPVSAEEAAVEETVEISVMGEDTISVETSSDTEVKEVESEEVEAEGATQEDITVGDFVLTPPESGTEYVLKEYNGTASTVDLTTGDIAGYNITIIGDSAFEKNKTIVEVVLPDTLKRIGKSAFSNCTSLKICEIPSGVESIGSLAFYSTGLTSVTIPAACISIENAENKYSGTFQSCTSLHTVTFEERTKEISFGARTFADCTALEEMILPDQVKVIPEDFCRRDTSLNVIRIPEECETIASGAFCNTAITSLYIPAGVEQLSGGKSAVDKYGVFSNCTSLKTVTFAERTQPLVIGKYMFSDCSSLTAIDIPDMVEEIAPYAFYRCSKLGSVELPSACETVNNKAFYGCDSLTSVVIPDNVTVIGESAFEDCDRLNTITLSASCESIGERAFLDCSALKEIKIPDTCVTIGEQAFQGCTLIKEITIPESCISIDGYAFNSMSNLKKVTFLNPDTALAEVFTSNYSNDNHIYFVSEPGAVADYTENYSYIHHWRPSEAIEVTVLPNKTQYMYGENIVLDGMVVEADFVTETDPVVDEVATEDCIVTGYDSKKVGKQTLTVSYGGAETTFDVTVSYDISKASGYAKDVVYTGQPLATTADLKGNITKVALVEGKDYVFEYVGDHTNAGRKTVKVVGKGYYAGSKELTFDIDPKPFISISNLVVKADNVVYTGKAVKTNVTVSYGSVVISPNDYTVTYENNKNAGTANITVTAKNNYKGTAEGTFKVTRKSIAGAKVKFDKSSYAYTTKAIKPKVTVTLDGKELVKGTDYSVTYENNVKVGKGVVTIKGKNNYKDKFTKKFTIKVKNGTTFTIGSYKYKVTSADKKEVAFTALTKSSLKKVAIPATVKIAGKSYKVTSVANNALKKKTKITSVTIGKNVTKIGKNAFSGCKNLKNITVKGTKLESVGTNAIKGVHEDITLKLPKKKMKTYKILFKNAIGKKEEFKTTKL